MPRGSKTPPLAAGSLTLRYPEGKKEITGTDYEPWHYRYVGEDAAAEIYRQGICLEEYTIEGGSPTS